MTDIEDRPDMEPLPFSENLLIACVMAPYLAGAVYAYWRLLQYARDFA